MKLNYNCEILSYENQEEKNKWHKLCKLIKNLDVFYYPEYGELFELHGDGQPFLFVYYQSSKDLVIYPFLKRSLNLIPGLQNLNQNLYDITSPYGFGGYLPSSDNIDMTNFLKLFHKYCQDNNIISEFVRFHPLLENVKYVSEMVNINYCNQTIYVDLKDEVEDIWQNMASRCRNAIRKANKNDIKIIYDKDFNEIDTFIKLYIETMTRLGADKYYYFSKNWFYNLISLLKENIALFHANYQGKIISSAIFTYNDYIINYFLTGSLFQMRHLSANNLLLYSVLLWAKRTGIRFFHLGGAYQQNESLYLFKKSFSPHRKQYFVGSVIHDEKYYDSICKLLNKNIGEAACKNYFPLYRYPCQDIECNIDS